jgi:hypothetical protein
MIQAVALTLQSAQHRIAVHCGDNATKPGLPCPSARAMQDGLQEGAVDQG